MTDSNLSDSYQVRDFNADNFRCALALDNKHLLDWKLNPTDNFPDAHFDYLLDYLNELKCKTILIERNYVDKDFLIDYSHYYVRCATQYERICKRLHFFKEITFTEQDVAELIIQKKGKLTHGSMNSNYLGFTVAKPLPDAIFGRTVLKTYPPEGDKRNYTCTKEYQANLFGLPPLTIEGLAFQEQDTVAAACATSALWSAFHKTSDLFESRAPSPIEITEFATRYYFGSRSIPSGGLTVAQMCQAIHEVGLDPYVSSIKYAPEQSSMPLVSFIYSYLKMGIPVILNVNVVGIGLHTITLTGFRVEDNRSIHSETRPDATFYCPQIGLRVKEFYAHDDRVGPHCAITVLEADNDPKEEYPIPVKFQLRHTEEILEPWSVIVPLYHKIRVIFFYVYHWVNQLTSIFSPGISLSEDFEWEIFLSTNEKFKKDIYKQDKYGSSRQRLLFETLPRFLWRCKFYNNKKEVFELIADPTDMDRSFFFRDLIFFDDTFKSQLNSLLIGRRSRIEEVLSKAFTEFLISKSS